MAFGLSPRKILSGQSLLGNPQNLLGAGLLAGSALAGEKEPGEVTEARQFLRNRFTSPTALTDQFTGQLGALSQEFTPFLEQQAQRQIESVGQRFKAAFPATAQAQGPEFGGLARSISDEIIPGQRAFLGNLGLNLLNLQGRAAEDLLFSNPRNSLAESLGQAGGLLLGSGGRQDEFDRILESLGIGSSSSQQRGGGGGLGGAITSGLAGVGAVTAANAIARRLGITQTGSPTPADQSHPMVQDISSRLSQPVGGFQTLPDGTIRVLGTDGQREVGTIRTDGTVVNGAGSTVGNVSQSRPTGVSTTTSPGQGINVQGQRLGSVAGGVTGAAAGAAIGEAIGGVEGGVIFPGVGSVLGAFLGSEIGKTIGGKLTTTGSAQKALFRQQDLDSQAQQVSEIGQFFDQALTSLGADTTAFDQFAQEMIRRSPEGHIDFSFQGISGNADQQDALATVGGKVLLRTIQARNPSITSLDQVTGLRQQYIDFLTRSTTSASDSAFGGGPPLNLIQTTASEAGL